MRDNAESVAPYRPASNTKDCFRVAIGRTVVGVLFDALPLSSADLRRGTKTLVFDDGTGLTIASNGTFWTESQPDIASAVRRKRQELAAVDREIRDVLDLAGQAHNDGIAP